MFRRPAAAPPRVLLARMRACTHARTHTAVCRHPPWTCWIPAPQKHIWTLSEASSGHPPANASRPVFAVCPGGHLMAYVQHTPQQAIIQVRAAARLQPDAGVAPQEIRGQVSALAQALRVVQAAVLWHRRWGAVGSRCWWQPPACSCKCTLRPHTAAGRGASVHETCAVPRIVCSLQSQVVQQETLLPASTIKVQMLPGGRAAPATATAACQGVLHAASCATAPVHSSACAALELRTIRLCAALVSQRRPTCTCPCCAYVAKPPGASRQSVPRPSRGGPSLPACLRRTPPSRPSTLPWLSLRMVCGC